MRAMYIGRFAPSPTGPLHFGSLVTAVASYLDARSEQGQWHLRIEDLDSPRTQAGASSEILTTLSAFGMRWDGPVIYQSVRNTQRPSPYQRAFDTLQQLGVIYPCACTRKEIADSQLVMASRAHGSPNPIYPGTCRAGLGAGKAPRAWRLKVPDAPIRFTECELGLQDENLTETTGDIVLLRADGIWAYQLAVVVDDAELGVTEVVRGQDLRCSTARQVYLQTLLGLPTPRYRHIPLVYAPSGEKLSKQTGATPLNPVTPLVQLNQALIHLGMLPIPALELASLSPARQLAVWWEKAISQWGLTKRAPRQKSLSS
ncbi:tRNA glutamyl-Q(34) synthetase GluQRS [Parvibium lacunae]|uniref:Glutamyl-Q tRNA(Asp) synthetase n=1 Tax=Parvibium lacunae TaxID=1888893 RepID=A0A368L4D7_9BURK|nr:tRNA glutamyl-Q(34) synthetase GluQRS [Parvibium lacunae]RCS58434.1 tRNA glutamyl-Q(34) synthetase GluQRS [Parvibium lacunae]